MCNCKKKQEPRVETPYQNIFPKIETTSDFDNIDEFFVPQTPDQLLDKELRDWKDLDKITDEEDEYPLIHD